MQANLGLMFERKAEISCKKRHRAELCDTSGIFTGAMALSLKDRNDKGNEIIKKNGRIGRGPPAFYSFTA